MNSASKVGEIFAKAGQSYNSLGDKIMKLHPAAQELLILEQRMAKKVVPRTKVEELRCMCCEISGEGSKGSKGAAEEA